MRARPVLELAIAASVAFGASVAAQAQVLRRPEAARRIVRAWTFDDPGAAIEPVPIGWFRAQDSVTAGRSRPGYPGFNIAELDFNIASSGDVSIRLPTRGGSTSLRLATGELPAIPDGDYIVSAHVRTDGLEWAQARLSAWLVDEERNPLESSASHSQTVNTEGRWKTISAPIRGDPNAAWIQIELELLQPAQLRAEPITLDEVVREDFGGAAWFDDIVVYQTPRLELRTQSSINLIEAPDTPRLTTFVRDLTGEPLDVELLIVDMTGAEIDRHRVRLPSVARQTVWTPSLPRYGWYRAVMHVYGPTSLVGQRHVDLIWTPPLKDPAPMDRQAFGLIAESMPVDLHALLPELMRRSRLGAVNLAVWRPDTVLEHMARDIAPITAATEQLLDEGVNVTFVLGMAPEVLSRRARVDRENPIPVLAGEDESWLAYLGDVLTRFGERVARWQLGGTGTNRAFFRPLLASELARIHERLRRIVPRPGLALPWGGAQTLPEDLGAAEALTITWPVGVQPRFAAGLSTADSRNVLTRLMIEPIDPELFGAPAASLDLAQRIVEGWAAGYESVAIDSPWSTPSFGGQAMLMPRPELAVYITYAQHLAGKQIVGQFDIGEGVRAHIARSEEGGSLIAWNRSAQDPIVMLRGYLGDQQVRLIDPFGNSSLPHPDDELHYSIPITETPLIIEGIDVELAQFRSALRIEPSSIAARAERHQVELVVQNPWNVSISGRIRISEPADWAISPRVLPFSLDARDSVRLPIELSFTLGEEAGIRHMVTEIELRARQRYPLQKIDMEVEIGLPSVELSAGYRIDRSARNPDGSADVIVTLRIVNRLDVPISLEAFAHAPGYRQDFRPISKLEPGDVTMRFFRFPAGGTRLDGKRIRVGVKERDGTGRLNRTIRIDASSAEELPQPEDD